MHDNRRETERRLVEDQNLGLRHQSPRNRQHLLLPAAQSRALRVALFGEYGKNDSIAPMSLSTAVGVRARITAEAKIGRGPSDRERYGGLRGREPRRGAQSRRRTIPVTFSPGDGSRRSSDA